MHQQTKIINALQYSLLALQLVLLAAGRCSVDVFCACTVLLPRGGPGPDKAMVGAKSPSAHDAPGDLFIMDNPLLDAEMLKRVVGSPPAKGFVGMQQT